HAERQRSHPLEPGTNPKTGLAIALSRATIASPPIMRPWPHEFSKGTKNICLRQAAALIPVPRTPRHFPRAFVPLSPRCSASPRGAQDTRQTAPPLGGPPGGKRPQRCRCHLRHDNGGLPLVRPDHTQGRPIGKRQRQRGAKPLERPFTRIAEQGD